MPLAPWKATIKKTKGNVGLELNELHVFVNAGGRPRLASVAFDGIFMGLAL